MKKAFLPVFLLCSHLAFAQQEWAPVGARWVQNIGIDFDSIPAPNPLLDYYIVECTGDSMINNLNFRKVGDHLMHQNGGKIYYWYGDSLNLVYDFEVAVGDTIQLNLLSCVEGEGVATVPVRIDSVGEILVSGQSLKRVVATNLLSGPDWFHPNGTYIYIEKIGRPDRVIIEDLATCAIINSYEPPWLRCYSDSEIDYKSERFLSFGDLDCEYQPPTGTQEVSRATRSVYPNPATDLVFIQTDESFLEARLYSLTGQLLSATTLRAEKQIDLSTLPQGLYWLQLRDRQGLPLGATKVAKL